MDEFVALFSTRDASDYCRPNSLFCDVHCQFSSPVIQVIFTAHHWSIITNRRTKQQLHNGGVVIFRGLYSNYRFAPYNLTVEQGKPRNGVFHILFEHRLVPQTLENFYFMTIYVNLIWNYKIIGEVGIPSDLRQKRRWLRDFKTCQNLEGKGMWATNSRSYVPQCSTIPWF